MSEIITLSSSDIGDIPPELLEGFALPVPEWLSVPWPADFRNGDLLEGSLLSEGLQALVSRVGDRLVLGGLTEEHRATVEAVLAAHNPPPLPVVAPELLVTKDEYEALFTSAEQDAIYGSTDPLVARVRAKLYMHEGAVNLRSEKLAQLLGALATKIVLLTPTRVARIKSGQPPV